MLEKLQHQKFCNDESKSVSKDLLNLFRKRKTTREFSPSSVDISIIENAVAIAATAPSGANKQPWSFAIIEDQKTKEHIQTWAEQEEETFYKERAPKKWLQDLAPLHTNEKKAFLVEAPYLIPIFSSNYHINESGEKSSNYYVKESVGIATGFLIAALHMSGLSTLTYTPSNRKVLRGLLGRPEHESTFMIVATGLPSKEAKTPVIDKKNLKDILSIYSEVTPRIPPDSKEAAA